MYNQLYQMVREAIPQPAKVLNTLDRFVGAGEAMPDGVVMLNDKDRIEWCNPWRCAISISTAKGCGTQISYLVRARIFSEYLRLQDFSHPLSMRVGRNQETVLSVQLVPFDVAQNSC